MNTDRADSHRLGINGLTSHTHMSDEVRLTQYSSPDNLAALGRRLIDAREFSTATVVLHSACELATERSISAGLARLGVPELDGPIAALTNNRSFLNDDVRDLFNAATGGRIQDLHFWAELRESTRRRNRVVHSGLVVGSDDAEASYSAVVAAIRHMQELEASGSSA